VKRYDLILGKPRRERQAGYPLDVVAQGAFPEGGGSLVKGVLVDDKGVLCDAQRNAGSDLEQLLKEREGPVD
jgi:hypothetical protein